MTPSAIPDLDALRHLPLLGAVAIYGVTAMHMTHAEFVRLLDDEGLGRFAPRAPSDVDVFRRVCTNAQRKRIPTGDPRVFVNVVIVDLANEKEEVVKRVVSQRCNPSGRVLEHANVYDLIFRRTHGVVRVRPLVVDADDTYPEAAMVAAGVVPTYMGQKGTVNSNHVRDSFKAALDTRHAVPIKTTGGAFFIPAAELATVRALRRVAKVVAEIDFSVIPVLDTADQRRMIQSSFVAHAGAELDRMIAELSAILRSGEQVSAEVFTTFTRRYQSAGTTADTYAQLLDEQASTVVSRLELLDRAMKELHRRGTPSARGRRPASADPVPPPAAAAAA